ILKVDGKSVAGKDIDDVVKMIRGESNTMVTLELSRGKELKPVKLSIRRQQVEYRMVEHEMLDKQDGIGWLLLRQFNSKADEQMDLALTDLQNHKMKGLILDLRDNPGGLLESAVEIGSRFIPAGNPVVIIKERGGETSKLEVDPSKQDHPRYPLVVLVNEMSASASEIVAGAIKDTKSGTLVGTETFGKGRVQTIVPLPGDSAVRITTAKYLTPNGHDIHRNRITKVGGIEPDVFVKALEEPAEDDDTTDRMKNDPQLQKAVAILKQQLVSLGAGKNQAMR
ncbi:MAG: S41 family peptidase, partial [Armatimonadota bacterium]